MKKIKTVFFGTGEFAATILKSLIKKGHNLQIEAVVTQSDKIARGRKTYLSPPAKIQAQKAKIPTIAYKNPTIISQMLKKSKPELILVSDFGKIVPKEILKIPKYHCLGIHPSLLPKYRGPSPIRSAILKGEKKGGVTIFLLDGKIDHGPIIASRSLPISPKITYERLAKQLAQLGGELMVELLPKWIRGEIETRPQNHQRATLTKRLERKDGFVEWSKIVLAMRKGGKIAVRIDRMVRAFSSWPGVWTLLSLRKQKKRLKLLSTHLEKGKLVLKKVQLEGKRPVLWKDFLQGHREVLS